VFKASLILRNVWVAVPLDGKCVVFRYGRYNLGFLVACYGE
jgi:hypothetical protein